MLVLGLHFGRGPAHRVLAVNPMHGLGLLSYATYLLHYPLLSLMPFDQAPLAALLPLYLMTAVMGAAFLYWTVERPGRRLVRAAAELLLPLLFPRRGRGGRVRPPLQDGSP